VWCVSGWECEYKVRKCFRCGCMRGVDGVEDDEHATGLTRCPPPAWCQMTVGAGHGLDVSRAGQSATGAWAQSAASVEDTLKSDGVQARRAGERVGRDSVMNAAEEVEASRDARERQDWKERERVQSRCLAGTKPCR
jgi:hypothetical protein